MDTVSLRGVFTQEANIEADNFIKQKKHILNQTGKNARTIGPEAIQGLYGLTREV